jgi:hypothetical protein
MRHVVTSGEAVTMASWHEQGCGSQTDQQLETEFQIRNALWMQPKKNKLAAALSEPPGLMGSLFNPNTQTIQGNQ